MKIPQPPTVITSEVMQEQLRWIKETFLFDLSPGKREKGLVEATEVPARFGGKQTIRYRVKPHVDPFYFGRELHRLLREFPPVKAWYPLIEEDVLTLVLFFEKS